MTGVCSWRACSISRTRLDPLSYAVWWVTRSGSSSCRRVPGWSIQASKPADTTAASAVARILRRRRGSATCRASAAALLVGSSVRRPLQPPFWSCRATPHSWCWVWCYCVAGLRPHQINDSLDRIISVGQSSPLGLIAGLLLCVGDILQRAGCPGSHAAGPAHLWVSHTHLHVTPNHSHCTLKHVLPLRTRTFSDRSGINYRGPTAVHTGAYTSSWSARTHHQHTQRNRPSVNCVHCFKLALGGHAQPF